MVCLILTINIIFLWKLKLLSYSITPIILIEINLINKEINPINIVIGNNYKKLLIIILINQIIRINLLIPITVFLKSTNLNIKFSILILILLFNKSNLLNLNHNPNLQLILHLNPSLYLIPNKSNIKTIIYYLKNIKNKHFSAQYLTYIKPKLLKNLHKSTKIINSHLKILSELSSV